jgi:F-type H+-transporting ATPase subunit alpha
MNEFSKFLEKTGEIGYITSLFHSIALVSGLPSLRLGEKIITEEGEIGLVYGIGEKTAEILMFETSKLRIGQRVAKTGELFSVYGSEEMLGRILDPLLKPLDELGPIRGKRVPLLIEREAPKIGQRIRINRPFETGWMVVDLLIPLGYGQRELIIGDSKVGKTKFLLDTILNQTKKGAICVYVSIGKRAIDVKSVEEYLKEKGAIKNSVILVALANQPSSLIFLAPFSGMAIAEYFRDLGRDVVLVLDDMTTHAKVYREICLLLKRSPGRNAYPGDIFHIHAALMERAGNIRVENKEVSITCFPVAETLENDISGYIQTNLIGMTDGHIFFDINEFRRGKRPAINPFLSVSRVGKQTRRIFEQHLANWLQLKLGEYKRALEIVQFGVELSKKTREIINLGEKIETVLEQFPGVPRPIWFQIFLIGLLRSEFFTEKPIGVFKKDLEKIFKAFQEGLLDGLEKEILRIKTIREFDQWIKEKVLSLKEILE